MPAGRKGMASWSSCVLCWFVGARLRLGVKGEVFDCKT